MSRKYLADIGLELINAQYNLTRAKLQKQRTSREYLCSDPALRLYISDIGLGWWVIIIHETVCRQWFGRASVVWAVSWVGTSDSRLYRWRPPKLTRGSQSMLRS